MLTTLRQFVCRHPAIVLGIAAIFVFCCHLLTFMDYPTAWLDEAWILEIGRSTIFDVHPENSIVLFPSTGDTLNPMGPHLSYVFSFLQESIFRLTRSFPCCRLFVLSSLPLATILLYLWLRAKNITTESALLAAAFFLTDLNATICVRWSRPDVWTLVLAFLALTLLAQSRHVSDQRRICACILAGGISALMPFFWITSASLLPLIAWEAVISERDENGSIKVNRAIRNAGYFIAAGLLTTVVILLPHLPNFNAVLEQFLNHSEIGTGFNGFGTFSSRLIFFIKIACRSPFIWILALAGVFLARDHRVHAGLFALVCGVLLSTRIHPYRVLQLQPFLYLFAALAIDRLTAFPRKRIVTLPLLGALASYFTLSVLVLNYAGWSTDNNYRAFSDKFKSTAPENLDRVYLCDIEYETYFPGRELGWRMYSYQDHKYFFDPSQSANLIDKIDAVVVTSASWRPRNLDKQLDILAKHGFRKTSGFTMPPKKQNRIKAALTDILYAHGYPSCDFYTRSPKAKSHLKRP